MLFQFRDFLLTVLKMSIKTALFFFVIFGFIITSISGIINHYCIMENLTKNREKTKTS